MDSVDVDVMPDGLSAGQIMMRLAGLLPGCTADALALFQDLSGLLDLIPELQALDDHDRRGCVGAAMVVMMTGTGDPQEDLRRRADWIEGTEPGRNEVSDPHAVAEGVRRIADIMAWPG